MTPARTVAKMLTRRVQHDGTSFDAELLTAMEIAYDIACAALALASVPDVFTVCVADKIVELAKAGVRDSDRLCALALAHFNARRLIN